MHLISKARLLLLPVPFCLGLQTHPEIWYVGANTGIGFETARILANLGAHVILACRDEKRGTACI